MRSLRESTSALVDLGVVLMIGLAFAAMAVVGFIIWTLRDQLWPTTPGATTSASYNQSYKLAGNITAGFDDAIALILVAVTVWILAIAISALLILRGRQG